MSILEELRELRGELRGLNQGLKELNDKVDVLTQESTERDKTITSLEEGHLAQGEYVKKLDGEVRDLIVKNLELEISNGELQEKIEVLRVNVGGIGGNLDYLTAVQMRSDDRVSNAIDFVAKLQQAGEDREAEENAQAWEKDVREHPDLVARIYGDSALYVSDLYGYANEQRRERAETRDWSFYPAATRIAPGLGDNDRAPQKGLDSTLRFSHNGALSPGHRSAGGGGALKWAEYEKLCYPKDAILSLQASIAFITGVEAYNGDPNTTRPLQMAHMFSKDQKNMIIAFFGHTDGICVVGDQSFLARHPLWPNEGPPPVILDNKQVKSFLKRHAAAAAMTPASFCATWKANVKYDGPKTVTPATWADFLPKMLTFTSRCDEVVSFLTLDRDGGQQLPITSMRDGGLLHTFFRDTDMLGGTPIYHSLGRDFVDRLFFNPQIKLLTFSVFAAEWSKHVVSAYKAHMAAAGYVVNTDPKKVISPVPGPAVHAIDEEPLVSSRELAVLRRFVDDIDNHVLTNRKELVKRDSLNAEYLELKSVPKICFDYFRGRCLKKDGSCKYSHSDYDVQEYREHLLKMLDDHKAAHATRKVGPQPKFSALRRPDYYEERDEDA